MTILRPTLAHLAQQAAAQLNFTRRRWWREKTNSQVLRVEIERRLVGAPLSIAVLTVPIPSPADITSKSGTGGACPTLSTDEAHDKTKHSNTTCAHSQRARSWRT
jgi:hypothetical protein